MTQAIVPPGRPAVALLTSLFASPWMASWVAAWMALTSCARTPEAVAAPSWIALAQRLAITSEPASFRSPWRDEREVEVAAGAEELLLRIPLVQSDWTHVPEGDLWRTPVDLYLPKHRRGTALRLETPAGSIPRADLGSVRDGAPLQGFALYQRMLLLGGTEPPATATLTCRIRGLARGTGRVTGGDFSGDGLSLRSGTRASCTLDLPPASALRFGTMVDPLLIAPDGAAECAFEVRVDGALAYEHREPWDARALPVWHRVPLPAEGRAGARIELVATGMLANLAFLGPRIGPLEVGRRGERPWGDTRPDVVLLLADTFRADNLGAYGGTHGITPHLDALAARSLCFTHTWSPATWTLPSHASLLTGFYPLQVHSGGDNRRLPQGVETVIEELEAAGYRTGALTDGGLVSGEFGLDQGFEHFSERTRDLADKWREARDFLAADDGRPVFLFVQSYRVHWPYRASAETLREYGERLGVLGEAAELLEQAFAEARKQGHETARYMLHLTKLERTPELLAIAQALRAHYLAGVAEFDRGFSGFEDLLRTSGVLDTGYFVFTSDHGEGFAEHGSLFHTREPFEEQTRVPLLITGRGLAARRIDQPASLLDLAPTLAEMAGLRRAPGWPGQSLLGAPAPRPLFSFQARGEPDDAFSVLEEGKKAIYVARGGHAAEGELVGAFDLTLDAGEERDLSQAGESWPRELLARHLDLLEHALRPTVQEEAAEIDPERSAELRALGY
jgi:arylsulfatase A-like enzyme